MRHIPLAPLCVWNPLHPITPGTVHSVSHSLSREIDFALSEPTTDRIYLVCDMALAPFVETFGTLRATQRVVETECLCRIPEVNGYVRDNV